MSEEGPELFSELLRPQREITWGSYFWKCLGDVDQGTALPVFGHCHTIQEIVEEESDAGASPIEVSNYMERRLTQYQRGLRYARHYSRLEPHGELGSSHVADCWPITEEDFNFAREHGWLLSPEASDRIQNEIERAVAEIGQALEAHAAEPDPKVREEMDRQIWEAIQRAHGQA